MITVPGMRPETEAHFQAGVLRLAGMLGWLPFHTFDSRRSNPGFPDLFLVRRERAIAAELKSERGKATADQELWLAALSGAGIEAYLWRPSQWQAITETLR